MKQILALVVLLAIASDTTLADKPCGGHGGDVKCTDTVCKCAGHDMAMRKEGEPDNPKNKEYPRAVCLQACSKTCCSCTKRKATAQKNIALKHDAAGHVTRAGRKPSCAACLLSRKAPRASGRLENKR